MNPYAEPFDEDEDNPYAHAWEVESTLWFRGDILIRQPKS